MSQDLSPQQTMIPGHYNFPVTPWCLQKHMPSTGNVFIDSRRTDAIEYAFRIKENLEEDLRKGAHCLLEAADHLAEMNRENESLEK